MTATSHSHTALLGLLVTDTATRRPASFTGPIRGDPTAARNPRCASTGSFQIRNAWGNPQADRLPACAPGFRLAASGPVLAAADQLGPAHTLVTPLELPPYRSRGSGSLARDCWEQDQGSEEPNSRRTRPMKFPMRDGRIPGVDVTPECFMAQIAPAMQAISAPVGAFGGETDCWGVGSADPCGVGR